MQSQVLLGLFITKLTKLTNSAKMDDDKVMFGPFLE